ncbi:dCTP deaminase domain-containing protein [Bradyrhizobium niftali]|uniref:Deoxycytidine triphosphate deaminase n=1 Tax=Bradyrhizobium niftali TaxID=2560055 RepID=A0A4Y9L8C8_9BRAD|nr:deoxycytidine triphosphate deaminase [Bradyrhizobium niftali]TFV39820.1 deoxycytidine triphosphate deaminase [Bradyrhizobium niftali]
MSFWNDDTWRVQGAAQKVIEPFDSSRIEDAKYMLSVGDEVYVSDEASKKTPQKLKEGDGFAIDPGQFAFLLSDEIVNIPFNMLGFISIRATIKFYGLVNISGFHVDPGYEGRLIFSVFNAGPTRIQLKRGEQIFSIWLAELKGPIDRTKVIKGYRDIPSKLITPVSGKFTTAYQLERELDALKEDISNLKAFRTSALVIITIAGALLLPTFKDTVVKLWNQPPMTEIRGQLGNSTPSPPSKPPAN